jgi:hypothetical protein
MQLRQLTLVFGIAAVSAAVGIGSVHAENNPALRLRPEMNMNIREARPGLEFLPVIKDVKYECGNPSVSSVRATVVNKNSVPKTYTPVFTGLDVSAGLPGVSVNVQGDPVTVPGSEEAPVMIVIPNSYYKTASVSIGTVSKPILPPPSSPCIF